MTESYPFKATGSSVEIEGENANYKIAILSDKIPNEAIRNEATKLLLIMCDACNKYTDEPETENEQEKYGEP